MTEKPPSKYSRPETRPGRTEPPTADRKAAARILYEGQPGATCETVALEVGMPVGTLRRWKCEGSWKPAVKSLPDLSARAGALADSFKVKMAELGKPMSDEIAADEASKELATGFAIDVRAQILERHRKEWSAPRKIIYEAMAQGGRGDIGGAFDRAKLGKISSETLQLIQAGECRAYGITLEAKGADAQTVVVVERGSGYSEVAAPIAPSETDTTPDPEESF